MLEAAPHNNNENSSREELNSVTPETIETTNESLESKIDTFEQSQEQIQELTTELGGPEGVSELVNNLNTSEQERLQRQISEKQRSIEWTNQLLDKPLLSDGEGYANNKFARWVDTMYGLGEDKNLSKAERVVTVPIGLAMGGIFKPGVDLGRKLKIGFEKIKLKRLEKKLQKEQS